MPFSSYFAFRAFRISAFELKSVSFVFGECTSFWSFGNKSCKIVFTNIWPKQPRFCTSKRSHLDIQVQIRIYYIEIFNSIYSFFYSSSRRLYYLFGLRKYSSCVFQISCSSNQRCWLYIRSNKAHSARKWSWTLLLMGLGIFVITGFALLYLRHNKKQRCIKMS